MRNLLYLILLSFLLGCSNGAIQEALHKAEEELAAAKNTIVELESQIEPEGQLVHIVFFQLKPEADQAALIAEIKKLEAIDVVKDLEVGPFEDLGDGRALSHYQIMMEMSFDDAAAYKRYQAHPIHLALKESSKAYLAGPPATYDYVKR